MTTLGLHQIVLNDDTNCRTTDKMAGIETLAASIAAHGLLNPIQVRPAEGGNFEVVDGARRLTAIRLLDSRGEWRDQVEVVDLGGMTADDARELSLAANIIRKDIYPIDEYEAFSALIPPKTVQEVATAFGKKEWTNGERAAWKAFQDKSLARARVIMQAIPREGPGGRFECPVCGGQVSWSRARNGHIHAACSTRFCFSVMQ